MNGNMATLFTADEPDGLRGIQAHYAWADELAAWRQTPDAAGMTSWDNLRVATRLGTNPQIIATTTPKRVPILYGLIDEQKRTGRVIISKGSTLDNSGNFFVHRDDYIASMKEVFEDPNYPYFEADAVVFCYNWLKSGNAIEVVDNLWYNHTTRSNSYSHSMGNRNTNSLEYHKTLMAQL